MLETSTPSSPGLFTYRGTANTVLMPMFVAWDGDPKPKNNRKAKAKDEQPAEATLVEEAELVGILRRLPEVKSY